MEFITQENKATVVIAPAPLQDAFKLKSLIQKALLAQGVSIEDILEENFMNALLAVDSSQEVFDCLFECLKKSTYNGIKITKEVFENEAARYDLYEVFFQCVKVNLYPFFKNLLSRFQIKDIVPQIGESQPSK